MAGKKVEITVPNISLQKVMVGALIVMAFVIGMLFQRVRTLEGGNVAGANTNTAASPTPAAGAAAPTVSLDAIRGLWGKDLVKFGDANKKVLFVEIGDPSCPYCHVAGGENHAIYSLMGGTNFKLAGDGGTYVSPVVEMRKLVNDGKAGFVYVYYPGHGNGEMGMKSLYCANEKGKFWEAHDLIMSDKGYDLMNNTVKNDKTQSQAVANFLKSAIDASFMKSCLDSGKYDSRLTADMAVATSLGVQGTPGFFINDKSYPGAYSWNDMKTTADAALK